MEIPSKAYLDEKEINVLQSLHYNSEMCYAYDLITDRAELTDRIEAQAIVKRLRGLELVEYVRGLMDDDGNVAGAGFCRTPLGNEIIKYLQDNELLSDLEWKKYEDLY